LLPFSLPALFPPDLFLMKITFAGVFSIDSEAFKNYNSAAKNSPEYKQVTRQRTILPASH